MGLLAGVRGAFTVVSGGNMPYSEKGATELSLALEKFVWYSILFGWRTALSFWNEVWAPGRQTGAPMPGYKPPGSLTYENKNVPQR